MTAALVALFGGLGSAARFVVDGVVRARSRSTFPVATLAINVTGSLVLGLLVGLRISAAGQPGAAGQPAWFTVAATGFCGGFTTFSTAMVETVRLLQADEPLPAVANVLGSLLLAVAAAALGVAGGAALG